MSLLRFFCLSCLCTAALLAQGCGGDHPSVRIGSEAPEFSLFDLEGQRIDSESLRGQPLVLNFWATWCQPCRKEIPVLKEVQAAGRARVVGIALDDDGSAAVEPFVREAGIEYTVLLGNQDVFQRFGGFTIPFTLVLDSSFRVVNLYRGPVNEEALTQDLQRMDAGAKEVS